jgi:glutaredoxin 3
LAAPRITLYGTRRCPACRQARDYLKARGLAFKELDIERNLRAQKTLARLGARGVPVIVVGETAVNGFDRGQLDRLLPKT